MSKHLQTLAKYCSFGVPIDQGQFKTYLAHVLFLDPAGVSCLAVLQTQDRFLLQDGHDAAASAARSCLASVCYCLQISTTCCISYLIL